MAYVLIVDDEPPLCDVIATMLEDSSLEPLCANSDREAYAALRSQQDVVALVTDINLGAGTTGFDVARAARTVRRTLAVVYASGDAAPESVKVFGVPGSVFLQKPFTRAQLLEALERQLGRSLGL